MMRTVVSALLLTTIVSVPLGAGWRVEGDTSYKPPAQPLTPPEKSAKFDAPRDLVWTAVVSYLSQTAFAIDQISKESGLISIKFSEPDPRRAIDCGVLTTWVSNMRGRRDYTVEGAQPQAEFEEYGKGKLVGIERTVSLSGVINIFVLAVDEVHTTVRVNVRYVAQKRNVVHDRAAEIVDHAAPAVLSSTVAFNSGEIGEDDNGSPTRCVSRFTIEKQILSGVAADLAQLQEQRAARPTKP
jgi:hypothetical protein